MSEKLKIVYRPLQELSPYAHNARTHSPEQVAQLVESIKQFGWTNPVLIDEKGEIIAGHGRVMAAEVLKMDSIPVIVLSGLMDDQKKAYRLADNRLPMNAGWDEDLLRMELSDLINADFDVSLTGFSPTEIDELLTDVLPGTENEEEPYTTTIDTPVYEPSGGKPDISELYDDTKTQELISRIRSASLEPDIEKFLLCAAERHTVFNFSRIADYYAHAPAEIQCFFEESALVIIDYQQAIENGFVRMTQRMVEIMHGGEAIPGKFLSLLMMKIRHGISTWLNLVNRCWCFPKPISPVVLTKPIISVTAAQCFTPVMPVSTWQNWSGVNTSFSSMMIITSSSFGWIATMTRPIFR